MSEKSESRKTGLIFVATIAFIVGMIMIGYQFKLQPLDIFTIILAIGSLLLASYQRFIAKDENRLLDIAHVVVAAILALRFGLPLLFDLASLPTLLLYGSIILFFYIAISGAISLFAGGLPSFATKTDKGTTGAEPVSTEEVSEEIETKEETDLSTLPAKDAENPVEPDATEAADDEKKT
ncbi:hypothetical protein [Ponticaulis koreensis]|uniref:hypothetical protein n=1 Tax=Ponticaulis koreensis TaxID=1123045 RepID=UPI0003B321D0|nr:hypothetical protein [Ponticaulis koreensis]